MNDDFEKGIAKSAEESSFIVQGTISFTDKSPAIGLLVWAFDVDLRNEQELGREVTNGKGFYRIRYSAKQFEKAEKGTADLIIKVTKPDGEILIASRILFNAPEESLIDLTIPEEKHAPDSKFEKIKRTLDGLLNELRFVDLEEDEKNKDLSFLSGETGFEKSILARFVLAHRLANYAIEPEFWFAVLGGSVFQYDDSKSLDFHLSGILDALVSLDAFAVRKALVRSFNLNEIQESFRPKTEDWEKEFLEFIVRLSLSKQIKPTFAKLALEDAGIQDARKQQTFSRLFSEHQAFTPELLSALQKSKFDKREIADLNTSFNLSELIQSDFSVVKAIKDKFDVHEPKQIRTLAKKSEAEWMNFIKEKEASGELKLPIAIGDMEGQIRLPSAEIYGKTLEQKFMEAFPTTAFTGGLERALNNGGARGLRHGRELNKLLNQYQDFELLKTPIDDFLDNLPREYRQLSKNNEFRTELKAVQRVFKLAPTFDATDQLLADNLHSAQKVYRMGRSEFVRSYGTRPGFTSESAQKVWNRAADTHAAALTIIGDLKALEAEGLPRALTSGNQALSNFPNWNNLFKSGDFCECEHCRSVLSPAAYFADILMFLKDRKAANPAFSCKDILFKRRPDLGYIELNCENALTPLPYVDVVCEVLEDVVASGENDLELTGFTAMPANSATAKTDVAIAFASKQIILETDFSLSQVDPSDPNRWVVHGDDVTYLLKKKTTPNFFAEILRNTKTTAAELRAYPQYVNPKAYKKLREAMHPLVIPIDLFPEGDSRRLEQRARSFSLPFDLFAEETRLGFQKCNLKRWDLMKTFLAPAGPNVPTEGDIAAEYFSISADPSAPSDEKRLILNADPSVPGLQEVWGEVVGDAAWLNNVSNVKKFLQKTGLEFNELLTLIDLKFINPAGDIRIHDQDLSCDTEKKDIQGLDEPKLDRIHRFLRLWRKLKDWKMWELDLVIRGLQIGKAPLAPATLDEALLVHLFYFCEVRNKLGAKTKIEQVLALFGNLSTETHFTKRYQKREQGLYQFLFLNKRFLNPVDPELEVSKVDVPAPTAQQISAHHPAVLAALGIRETDLVIFKSLMRPNGAPYITDDLTLTNLSFLWRHSWLSKALKLKAEEWNVLLRFYNKDILVQTPGQPDDPKFTEPKAAWEFLEMINLIKKTGFSIDEQNWILSADLSAKSAVKEKEGSKFLLDLRKAVNLVKDAYGETQYDFIKTPKEEPLVELLKTLLQNLNRNEGEVNSFIAALQGQVVLQVKVENLPAGFMFPAAITAAPKHIPIEYDEPNKMLRFTGMMTQAQQQDLLNDGSLGAVLNILDYKNAIKEIFQEFTNVRSNYLTVQTKVVLGAGITLPNDRPSLPILYDSTTQMLSFTGMMTPAEQAALKAIPANTATAIDELFILPRFSLKFYEPVFTAQLEVLPTGVDFRNIPALVNKIDYDAEQRQLRFKGIMTLQERSSIDGLVPSNVTQIEQDYHNAVNSLATQPQTIVPPDFRVWLTDVDLDPTVVNNNTFAKRLANASRKALQYLSKTLSENTVVQQCSDNLGLSPAIVRTLVTRFSLIGTNTILKFFIDVFSITTGPVDYVSSQDAFDTWHWLNRVASILKKWKIDFNELETILTLKTPAQLLDLQTLPVNSNGPLPSLDRFLRASQLMRIKDSLPETKITFLEVLEKLNTPLAYPAVADFAADVEKLNEAWLATDVQSIVNSINLNYPADFLLAENWERLRRAFYFIENVNGNANTIIKFGAIAMTEEHAKALKMLLHSKFGPDTWLTLSAEIQDALRDRKRDALVAYLLTHPLPQPMPANAPTGKWENPNDLYAYYLLDVEMCACMLTSRLVQGSGSVQLFVQRCFMGLEPDVQVKASGDDGDSAWRWWKWMRKYRPWEANLQVFLGPERYILPELKKDRSQFMKDLENELMQNEITPENVSDAFTHYLEKLAGVEQLEIAGFYQEDDADNTIVHVFGRTKGAEPHLYYYRRYDYRQWTPWEKVDVDIQGDHLIPAVVNSRLFLFWPVFSEVPAEDSNKTSKVPVGGEQNFQQEPAGKKLRLQMAVSEYRQGKWTPKKISKDFNETVTSYNVDIIKKYYDFFSIDGSGVDGRFGVKYQGESQGINGIRYASLWGAFEMTGCTGVPEKSSFPGNFWHAIRPEWSSVLDSPQFMKWVEMDQGARGDRPENDFTLENYFSGQYKTQRFTQVLIETPWNFKMSPPWHLSYLDRLWLDGRLILPSGLVNEIPLPVGTWLPFFYNDKKRTFFVVPSLGENREKTQAEIVRKYYPEIKAAFRQAEDFVEGQIQNWLNNLNLATLNSAQRQAVEISLQQQFPDEPPRPYRDLQVKTLLKRFFMRFFHLILGQISLWLFQLRRFHFKNFYHPFVCDFAKLVYNPLQGIPVLMSRETQLKDSGFVFNQVYKPTDSVVKLPPQYPSLPDCFPREVVDFTPDGAYSSYNWELFFHAPLFIANMLSKNQRFEEARDWYHFIFNPIGVESPIAGGSAMSKYWITKPFFETTDPQYIQQRIDNIIRMLAGDTSLPGYSPQAKKDLEDQVLDWRRNPFEPHRIANYRTVAYQKNVVMKYLDNLIEWGDFLFRQDSMESINEATQLYVLAAEILGPRPKKIPPQVKPPLKTFNELEKEFDNNELPNAIVEVENLIPPMPGVESFDDAPPIPVLYFCIPLNDKLLEYWDTIADRLYKIRHCMNIEGVVRQLALFEPPIDPMALVKAVAAGLDISAALADLSAPLPLYRFNLLLQKANEVCNDVKALGNALLVALEKKDAESIALLRQSQEIKLQEAVKTVREKQIEEAKENLEGLKKNKELAQIRKQYYESREFMNAGEIAATVLNGLSIVSHTAGTISDILAGVMFLIPDFKIGASGFGGSPHFAVEPPTGQKVGQSVSRGANGLYNLATILDKSASLASTLAGYERRQDEWDFQGDLATKELEQIDKQIAAAELRVSIAEKELENHVLQIENAKALDAFMRSKYTSEELYQWQISQISGTYFQSYKLAYDLAKRAERCFRFELGLQDSSFIQFGYWDSLKKGLLSGDKLQYDLRRLDNAYVEQNRREFELTKHVSLALLDPLALIRLKETGRCFVNLPEEIFDLDYPGHYFRRIKSVSLTLPCIAGPYTTVSCTLRLLKNSIRINTASGNDGYVRNTDDLGLPADDERFIENNIPCKSIAVSSAQNDSGVFELQFRDDRYLPFEGAGTISQWSVELFNDLPSNNLEEDFGNALRQFDYDSITDVIIHIKYTAREDAGSFKNSALTHLRDYLEADGTTPSFRLLNLRKDFPSQWYSFLNPTNVANGNIMELEMSPRLFSFKDQNKNLKINLISIFARCTNSGNYSVTLNPPPPPAGDTDIFSLVKVAQFGELLFNSKTYSSLEIDLAKKPEKWSLKMLGPGGGILQKEPPEVEDLMLVLGYEWET